MNQELTISAINFTAAVVPLDRPVHTASGSVEVSPLILIDLLTEEGVTGHAYLFCYTPLAHKPVFETLLNLEPLLIGQKADPVNVRKILDGAFRLVGDQGFAGMAVAGIDMACWDALARAAELPLNRLLGGNNSSPLATYDSLGMIAPDNIESVLQETLDAGFKAVKIKLGFPDVATDIEVVRRGRAVLGDDVDFMVDYNQSLRAPEAISRIQKLSEFDLLWIEEPVLATAHEDSATVRSSVNTAIQLGENWWGPADMKLSLDYGASDFVMPDVMKIGGVSGWKKAAAMAEAEGLPMSSHLFCEISAHLMLVTPTRHYLEYLDVASAVLQSPLQIEDGAAIVPDRPGSGLEWDLDAVKHYQV
ncbi:MAG: mandelate racemase [Alphaproteobacteria bacterium]|nr:mandelate racemase [Alphaproteobacteria bacterium]MBT4085561.1 mandelate racemase [Alphaproteobacteria bacterium]MBT4544330.1 mandelate racemase [Alphaproteobacteria bacterium]